MTEQSVVVGVDGGGTYTRVLCCGMDGQALGYAQAGGSSPQHNRLEDAIRNVQSAIEEAVTQAGRGLEDVAALTAGLAGLDKPRDLEWAAQLTALDTPGCRPVHVNDSVIAHAGALLSRPGIIVICGTGSILYAVNEAGQAQRNYDFYHYADASARALALDALHRLLIGEALAGDEAFTQAILDFWQAEDLAALRNRALAFQGGEWTQAVHAFGKMAFLVTRFAVRQAPLACRVCDKAAQAVRIGICLLGDAFTTFPVSVALIGSAARSPAMQQTIERELNRFAPGKYRLEEPELSSVAGAVLMALRDSGVTPDAALIARLRAHPQATFPALEQ